MTDVISLVEKPEVFVAMKWDGTPEGTRKLVDMISEYLPRLSFSYRAQFSSGDTADRAWLEVDGLSKRDEDFNRIYPDGWVVVGTRNHSFRMVSEERMHSLYEVIKA